VTGSAAANVASVELNTSGAKTTVETVDEKALEK
jgi:hypothetical protein